LFGDTLLETPGAENIEMISNSLSCTFDIDAGDGIAAFSDSKRGSNSRSNSTAWKAPY
jgi:hypothetical protein